MSGFTILRFIRPLRFWKFHLMRLLWWLWKPSGRNICMKNLHFFARFIMRLYSHWETEGFRCLRHSNWNICIPLNPFCSNDFPSFSLSYWEANSYYSRGPIMGKGNSSNPKSEWDRGFSVPGAFKLDHLQPLKAPFVLKIFHHFHFHTESPILITPEGK